MIRPHLALAPAAALLLAVLPAAAQSRARTFDFGRDQPGREPSEFLPMVGTWVVTKDEGRNVLFVDGRVWKKGQPAGGLADKARAIYGAEHEEFLDNVKQFAYFPIAVNKDVENFEDGEISVKFKMIGGTLDRCAGILFNVKPNGDWLTVRYNGTEDNLVLWKFVNGRRSMVLRAPKTVPLELGTWNEIRVAIKGAHITAFLNGDRLLDYDWTEPISGKVGLWSKTDSMTEFDAFAVAAVRR
jgi:prepilin-type processing-associated H-X9-DG protein